MYRRTVWFAALLVASIAILLPGPPSEAASDLEACLAEPMPPKQIACLSKAAIAAGDPATCLRADHLSVRWPCVALFADHADDPALCRILPADEDVPASVSRDLCRVHLAVSRRDPVLCEGLTTPNLGDGCYYQLVETGGDPALCERIANPDVKSVCALDPEQLQ